MLSTVGVLITTVVTGLLIYYLSEWTRLDIGLTLPMSMLLAATVSSTDSASVFNLLRTQRIELKHRLRPLLEMESGSNDPMAYVLTVALVNMIVTASSFIWLQRKCSICLTGTVLPTRFGACSCLSLPKDGLCLL